MTRNILCKLSVEDIRRAIRYGVLERRRESLQGRLDAVMKEMASLDGNGAAPVRKPRKMRSRRKGYKLSAATRRKMSESAKRRYAGKGKPEAPKAGRKPRKLSAAGRTAISAASKARWEKMRAAAQAKAEPKAEANA